MTKRSPGGVEMSIYKRVVRIFIVANVFFLALALTIGMAAAIGINVPDEYTTIHDAWANAQVAHAPSEPWSFNGTRVVPFSDRWEANFQIGDFMANFQSLCTARKPALSTVVWQQEQPQTSGASRAVVGSWGDIYHVPSVAYPTIQQAIDNATGGETILVEPGRYNETLVINVSHLLIKANSTNPADTIISANGTDDHVINITNQTMNVTIEGFTIQDARGASQDVAGIYMDNTHECAISNTVIRNISAAGSIDAYGVMMIGTTITPRLTDTTIRTILGERNSVGIFMENARNPSFDPTLIENVTASNGTAFGILMAVTDGGFSDTTIRDIAGNSSAYGIFMIPAINVTFDPTIIERVTASAPNGEAYGIYASIINGSFIDTTIRDIAGNTTACGINILYAIHVAFLTGELTNCGHGAWLDDGEDNRIEGFIIRDNTLFDTGVHLETDTSNTTVYRNCFFNNVLQAWDNGTNNLWDGNYWEPPPYGAPEDPYLIPGNAASRDTAPLTYCPLCAIDVPVTTPLGILALVGLLSAVATLTIATRKRR